MLPEITWDTTYPIRKVIDPKKYTGMIGIGAAAICLMMFGPDSFMVPAMLAILALLTAFRKPIEKSYAEGEDQI